MSPAPEEVQRARLTQAGEDFARAYLSAVELAVDRQAAAELRAEALPALDALLRWLDLGEEAPDALLRSETLAMASLLGRRAARLGVTPSAALGLVNGLLEPLRSRPLALGQVEHPLRAVCMEGYVAAVAEQDHERRGALWVERAPILQLGGDAVLLLLEGLREPAQLTELGERFARVLFRKEARAGWLDLTGLLEPSVARAGALLGIDESARTLGCPLIFSGVDAAWRDVLERGGENFALLRIAPSFAKGLEQTLALLEREIRPRGTLASALRRLRGGGTQ